MANDIVQVEPDGSGKSLQAFSNTVNSALVYAQASALVDQTGTPLIALGSTPTGTEFALVVRNIPSGTQVVTGSGVAGTPASGVVSIQGVAGGTPVPISGSITATNPSVGTDGSTLPTSSTLIGASDGTNLQQLLVESAASRNLRIGIWSGVNLATVTAGNALKIDGSAVTQPVSISAALPAGANVIGAVTQSGTWTVQPGNTPNTTPWLSSISQGGNTATVSAGGALKIDGSAVTQPVSGAFFQATQPVSGAFFQVTQPVSIAANIQVVGAGGNGSAATGNPVLTAGSDGTAARTIKTTTAGSVSIQTENSVKATYIASVTALANTAASDIITIEAGTTKTVRIRKIVILNPGTATAAATRVLTLVRTTTAGTAGAIVPNPMDAADGAYSGLVRSKATGLGTAGVTLMSIPVFVPTGATAFTPVVIDFTMDGSAKAPTIAAGVTNGISLRDPGATGAAALAAYIEYTEE